MEKGMKKFRKVFKAVNNNIYYQTHHFFTRLFSIRFHWHDYSKIKSIMSTLFLRPDMIRLKKHVIMQIYDSHKLLIDEVDISEATPCETCQTACIFQGMGWTWDYHVYNKKHYLPTKEEIIACCRHRMLEEE